MRHLSEPRGSKLMPAVVDKLFHARLGSCELIRVEGTDWIVE